MGARREVTAALALAILAAGCFGPDVAEGLECGPGDACPPGQSCGADGLCHADGDSADANAFADAAGGMCDPGANPDLVACFQFEGDTRDGSGNGNHATPQNAAFAGGVDGQAFAFNMASRMHIDESESMDVAELTIEMWIQASTASTAEATLVDNVNQYELEISPTGTILTRCSIGGANTTLTGTTTLPPDDFVHIAVTYGEGSLRLYVGGALDNSTDASGALDTGVTQGTFIGYDHADIEFLTGRIDNLRIFSSARSPEQICRAAGSDGC